MQRRKWLAVGASIFGLLMVGSVAYAHYVYEDGYVWEGGGKCLFARAEISHGENDGGYARTDLRGVRRFNTPNGWGADCYSDWDRPPGFYAARNVLLKWSAQHEQWAVCVDGVYNYNEGTDHNLSKTSLYRLKCGRGHYANFGGAFTYMSPDWVGAHIYSGYDYLDGE
jgi:hypothetical protein